MKRFLFALGLSFALGLISGAALADSDVGGKCITTSVDFAHGDLRGPAETADGGWAGNACTLATMDLLDGGTVSVRKQCVSCESSTFNGLAAACRAALRVANCP